MVWSADHREGSPVRCNLILAANTIREFTVYLISLIHTEANFDLFHLSWKMLIHVVDSRITFNTSVICNLLLNNFC